jgi:hypothetical protein
MNEYEWVCVGCGLEIGGFVEESVHQMVQAHKRDCEKYQEWEDVDE